MTNLQRYDNNGLELVIDTQTGECFSSIRAMGRMVEVADTTISRYIKRTFGTAALNGLKMAEVPTATGVKTAALLDESQILEVIAKYKPKLIMTFAGCGLRIYLHGLAGYKYQAVEEKPKHDIPQTYADALMLAAKQAKQLELQAAKIEADKPKVEFAEAVEVSETDLEFNEFAKVLGWGRNRLMKKLRELNILMKNSCLPYQRYIDAGYFECSQTWAANGTLYPFALVTGKGQLWLFQKIGVPVKQKQLDVFDS